MLAAYLIVKKASSWEMEWKQFRTDWPPAKQYKSSALHKSKNDPWKARPGIADQIAHEVIFLAISVICLAISLVLFFDLYKLAIELRETIIPTNRVLAWATIFLSTVYFGYTFWCLYQPDHEIQDKYEIGRAHV